MIVILIVIKTLLLCETFEGKRPLYLRSKLALANYILYILLDILVRSIAVYFYELCSILASPKGESKYKWWVNIYSDTIH